MQFRVPQNIDMEDRIVGPLTLTQFFYLLFGGIIIYLLFNKLAVNGYMFFFILLATPIGLFSFALAFIKVQDRPFPQFVAAAIKYFSLPRTRVWQHYDETAPRKIERKATVTPKQPKKQLDNVRVKELADILDTKDGK